MTSERWRRIDEIFGDAIELPTEDRESLLQDRCASDAELLDELRQLLSDFDRVGAVFLERPAVAIGLRGLSEREEDGPLIGRSISSFRIKSLISRGGMGIVYLAEQLSPRRDVALKVLHPGIGSASVGRRFDAESRILGFLRHPNIAQVYESGVYRPESGLAFPYFAMELIPEAHSITRYADASGLSLPARLGKFLEACEAVHYGHQKGVIHRDLKPTNLLVDAAGHVKIIDFGIARATDSDIAITTLHTEAGQILGTLTYMSPEQAAADPSQIDVTTDIYSLGVVLFELLTGHLPYDVSHLTIHAAARVICEQAPARPSGFDRQIRADLEAVILKAIEKNRARRYQSVSEFAADIRNVLEGRPTSARPPTQWTRAMQWVARHPRFATAGFCVILLALTLIGTYAGVYLVNRRPDRLVVNANRSSVHLEAFNGNVLRRWSSKSANHVSFAEIVGQPASMTSNRLAVLGFHNRFFDQPAPLCAYSIDQSLDEPLWTAGIEISSLPEDQKVLSAGRHGYGVRFASLLNVFDDATYPGPELVVSFQHALNRCALRIYNLAGRLLFQVWQIGGISQVAWLDEPRLLVILADDGVVKNRLSGRSSENWHVLFAIRPEASFITNGYLKTESGVRPPFPIWYRYWHPTHNERLLWNQVLDDTPLGQLSKEKHVGLLLRIDAADTTRMGGIMLVVDEFGHEVPGSRVAIDDYRDSANSLPPIEAFQLRDEPPLASVYSRDEPAD